MKVEGILAVKGRQVQTVPAEADIELVLHRLSTLGIGCVVVSDDGRRVDGVLSERDVVKGLSRVGPRFLELRAGDVMERDSPRCSPGDSLEHVMGIMTRTRHRHLPVLDDDRVLCGLISIGDVVKHRLEELALENNVLRHLQVARR